MSNLRKQSQSIRAAMTSGEGLPVVSAIVLAVTAGVLAFVGMSWRYSAEVVTPLPGMNHLAGQLGWSSVLATMMLIAAWMVRGILMARLQYAVVISLTIHFLLMLSVQNMTVGINLTQTAEANNELSAEDDTDLALPDYGGMESPDADPEQWEVQSDTPEVEMQEQARQQTELELQEELEKVEPERPVEVAEAKPIERTERELQQEDNKPELERTDSNKPQEAAETVEAPEVESKEAAQPELAAKTELEKKTDLPELTERPQDSPESRAAKLEATKLEANRSDPAPKAAAKPLELAARTPRELQAATAAAESPEVAAAKAAQLQAQEAATELARRQAQMQARRAAESPAAARAARLTAANIAANRAEAAPNVRSQANANALSERATTSQTAQAAGARAESPQVQTRQAAGPNTTQQSTSVSVARNTNSGLPGEKGGSPSTAPSGSVSSAVTSRVPGRVGSASSDSRALIPTSGGAAQLARSTSSGGSPSAATSNAESVQVAATGRRSAPAFSASSAASGATRDSAATVPTRNAGSRTGSPGLGSQRVGSAALPSGASGRTGNGQARLGSAIGNVPTGSRTGTGRQASAVGTSAEQVAVNTAASTGSSQRLLSTGPQGTKVGRQTTGLPTATGRGKTSGAPSATGTRGIRAATGTALAGRTTEPSARLANSEILSGGTGTGLAIRSTVMAKLPAGAIRAEQTGTLVMSGPQAAQAKPGGGSLSGPGRVSVSRRVASLPGSASGLSAPKFSGRSTRPRKAATGATKSRSTSVRPALETQKLVAGLMKRSAPGAIASTKVKLPPGLSMRQQNLRRKAAETLGGNEASEKAVEAGLDWLARHQHPSGKWGIHDFHTQCKDHKCTGHGSFASDTAGTGLALLSFYGAAYTHQSGKHQETVKRGLNWLLSNQKANGDLFYGDAKFVWFYSHGMASIALCEAYAMTKDPTLREPAQKALDFIVESQHPQFGGWRYRPRFESDTSVSGWQLMALKSGEMAGLKVPSKVYDGVSKWLDSVEQKSTVGFKYHPSRPVSLAMTAEGLLMRQYLGAKRNDPKLLAGGNYLRKNLPSLQQRDAYYWYYATQVMFHMQGAYWDEWNDRMRDLLTSTQLKDGGPGGSWNPERPTVEKWGAAGGRMYLTCMNLLMLEVYYRHLPMYLQLEK